jgi:predicted PurR-regulated permease PerM
VMAVLVLVFGFSFSTAVLLCVIALVVQAAVGSFLSDRVT